MAECENHNSEVKSQRVGYLGFMVQWREVVYHTNDAKWTESTESIHDFEYAGLEYMRLYD